MTKLFFPMKKRRIVITSLFNKAHPFIRYDIGDIDSRKKKHFTKTILQINRRTNDIAVLPGKAPGLTLLLHYKKSIIEDDGNVKNLRLKNKPILL
jgi:phenylacetate-CoA ligase